MDSRLRGNDKLLRPWMGLVVDFFEFVGCKMGVDLGGGEIDVA